MIKKEVVISESDYKKLKAKAEEYGEPIETIIEWLVEEHLEEI